jgi:hypothetical protein
LSSDHDLRSALRTGMLKKRFSGRAFSGQCPVLTSSETYHVRLRRRLSLFWLRRAIRENEDGNTA